MAIANDFARAVGTKHFFHGDSPGHVDVSFYSYLASYVYCKTTIGKEIVSGANLESWVARMQEKFPMKLVFEDKP
jgi:hypothetical protein